MYVVLKIVFKGGASLTSPSERCMGCLIKVETSNLHQSMNFSLRNCYIRCINDIIHVNNYVMCVSCRGKVGGGGSEVGERERVKGGVYLFQRMVLTLLRQL